MRFVTVSGPPSSGKTAVILKTVEHLREQDLKVGVVKFDCLSTDDDELFRKHGILVRKGLAGALCPDHYFVSNVEECVQWGLAHRAGCADQRERRAVQPLLPAYPRGAGRLRHRQPQRHGNSEEDRAHAQGGGPGGDHEG